MKRITSIIVAVLLWTHCQAAGSWAAHGQLPGNASFCCSTLQTRLGALVKFKGSASYHNEQVGLSPAGYWSVQEAELQPQCRFTPISASEVAQAVQILSEARCTFAVRGGGHTAWAGAANIRHGLTIDLSKFNSVNISIDRSYASIGGGSRWLDVYLALDAVGLGVAGGRVGQVGVGGLTLGGGKSFFQSKYGFACDNVINFELISGEGVVLQVNQTSHSDLYKALKGGSNNFGIVTRFDLKTFEQGHLWGGEVLYNASTASQQYNAFFTFVEASGQLDNPTGDTQIIFAYVTQSAGQFFANFYTYTLPEAWPPLLSEFKSIEPILYSSLRVSNLSDYTIELGTGTPNGFRYLFGTLTFENDRQYFEELKNISDALFNPFFSAKNVEGLVLSVVMQPLTGSMLRPGCGQNSLGLCPSDKNLIILDLTVQWTLAANDTVINRAAQNLINWATARAEQRGILHQYIYLNYALEEQDPIASYGEKNLANMRAVSRKYDPSQVFQKLVPGGFKLYRQPCPATPVLG